MSISDLKVEEIAETKVEAKTYQLIQELEEKGDKESIQVLMKYFTSKKNIHLLSYTADALIKIGGKEVNFHVIKALRNKSWVTRMKAAEILGEIGNNSSVNPLIRTLRFDSESKVREWAAIALGRLGSKKAIKPLISALKKDSDLIVRSEAAIALGRLKGKMVKKVLISTFYEDKDYQVSWAAASALAKINDNKSKELLNSLNQELIKVLVSEKDETVLSAAAKTLGDIGNKIAAEVMYRTMKVSKEMVRLEINLALQKMARRFNYQSSEEFIKKLQ
ncbi:MAG: HEAT repeat domain-containing protein [Candidatus Heimdallarchaeota archaeon]|nr:HEAT repeat domain-containing protein [Candidatus Heimdallarchaeota archaeon]